MKKRQISSVRNFFYIGKHKTKSKAIQHLLVNNRDILRKNNSIYYDCDNGKIT